MGWVVYLLAEYNLFIVIPIGAIVYFGATWATNALTTEERALIGRLTNRARMRLLQR
jgi:hypothetical protein